MRRFRGGAVGAALLMLLLVALSGCGGAKGNQGGDAAKPAAGDPAKPATTDPAKPVTTDPAKPATTDPAKPAAGGTRYVIAAEQSVASYEVKEVFLIDSLNVTAVGKTKGIKGELVVENGTFKPSTVVVDVSQLKSDQTIRDNQIKTRALETNKFPTAEFTVSGVEGGAINLASGQEASFKLAGTAKIHGVEKPLVWDATAKLDGDTLKLVATVTFKMELFNIDPPNVAGRIRVDETVKLNVEFIAQKN